MIGPMRVSGIAWLVMVTGGVIGAGGLGCARNAADSQAAGADATVLISPANIVQVESRNLESGVTFTGEIVPLQVVEVNARIDGDLEEVHVRAGARVAKGQPLAVYRPRDVQDQLQAAEAQWLAAQAALSAAENAERRARRLFDAGGAASSDLEVAQAQRAAAQAGLDAASAQRNRAQDDAERLDVPSPITGWVSQVMVNQGDHTAIGDPLFVLVDTAILELSATVPSEALARVQPGTPIHFRVDAYPGETFAGVVDRVSPTTEPGTRQVRIYMRLPNPDGRLVGGLFAGGRVIDATRENATAAALSSLRKEGTEQVVYRVRGGHAERVAVTTGLIDEETQTAELLGPLSPGDSLLIGVLPGLRDGVRVRVIESSSAASHNGVPAQSGR